MLAIVVKGGEVCLCNTSYAWSEDGGEYRMPELKPGARAIGSEKRPGVAQGGDLTSALD